MSNSTPKTPASGLLLLFILLIFPPLSLSLSFSYYNTLVSLSHSLTTRVANLRASRGDIDGAARARAIAQKLEAFQGLGFWKLAWTMGYDYFRNYAWIDMSAISFNTFASAVSDFNELLRALSELSGINSEAERVSWVSRNYKNVLNVSRSLLGKLLKVFRQSVR